MNTTAVVTTGVVVGTSLLRVWQTPTVDRPVQSFRVITGGFLLGMVLSLVAMADKGLATGLGVLICVSALLLNISAFDTALSRVTK